MPEASTDAHQAHVLAIFARSKEGRIGAGDLKKKLTAKPRPGQPAGPVGDEADQALVGLIAEGLLAPSGGPKSGPHPRPNASYRLTEKGKDHLKPAKPDLENSLLEVQEAFILLQVFRSKGGTLTRSGINDKLKTKVSIGQLELDGKGDPSTIDYHLAELVEKGCLAEERNGVSVRYTFEPEEGSKALAAAKQHDAVTFTMTGETLNALLAAARRSAGAGDGAPASAPEEVEPDAAPPASSPAIGEREILAYLRELRAGDYVDKGLIPIFAIRKLVARDHGPEAAGHGSLDPLFLRMRSEDLLEMIAIADQRGATQEELAASIPGMNETIFYIVMD